MHGPAQRLIARQGEPYTIRNSTGGGDRSLPTYTDDGTLVAVIERRNVPRTLTDSGGTEVKADLELRAVLDATTEITPAGASEHPTRLVGPSGRAYRVVDEHIEDSGVTVLRVVADE